MTSSLHHPAVASAISTLHEHQQLTEEAELERLRSVATAAFANRFRDTPPAEFAEMAKDISMAVPAVTGELLYLLARANGSRTVVEFGTSFGVSLLYLAAAVRDNGGGLAIGTELSADKVRSAQESLAAAGLDTVAEVRTGDALTTLADVPGPIDLVLLDGWPDQSLPLLRMLEPRLRVGSLIVTDGLPPVEHSPVDPATMDDLYAHLREPANGYQTVCLPLMGEELEVSLRLR